MTASQFVFARLSASPALAEFVGEGIYPVVIPQGKAFPAVRYELVKRQSGRLRGGCVPDVCQVQVSVYAASYDEMEATEEAARLALDGYEQGEATITHLDASDGFEEKLLLFSRSTLYRVETPSSN